MKLIVGLGNPGKNYESTRHNIGFMVLDKVVESKKMVPFRLENQFNSMITQTGGIGEDRIILTKPVTFMNNSGEAVKKILSYYKIGLDDILVIHDDLDLENGIIRVRANGSSGGHNGLNSIIESLKSDNFLRMRIGIGSNKLSEMPAENYVLQKLEINEILKLEKSVDKAAMLVIEFINSGNLEEKTI